MPLKTPHCGRWHVVRVYRQTVRTWRRADSHSSSLFQLFQLPVVYLSLRWHTASEDSNKDLIWKAVVWRAYSIFFIRGDKLQIRPARNTVIPASCRCFQSVYALYAVSGPTKIRVLRMNQWATLLHRVTCACITNTHILSLSLTHTHFLFWLSHINCPAATNTTVLNDD